MPWQQTEHRDFSGGENLADDPRFLGENQAVLIENALITGKGQIESRPGMRRISDISYWSSAIDFNAPIDFYRHVRWRDGTHSQFVVSDKKLYLVDGTLLQEDLGDGPYNGTVFANKFLLVDGKSYYESDGTEEGTKEVELPDDEEEENGNGNGNDEEEIGPTLDEIRRCTNIVEHNNRIWGWGDPEAPHLMYYSRTNRYDYFDKESYFVAMARDDNEIIQVVEPMYGGLLIGKRTGWWLLVGDPALDISIRPIVTGQGPAHSSFETVEGELWYLADDGIRVLHQPDRDVFTTTIVSYAHSPLFEQGDFSDVIFGYYKQRLLVFYKLDPESPSNDFCSVLDLRFKELLGENRGSWSRIVGWPVTAITYCEGGFIWAGLHTGQLVRLFEGNDDLGEPIKMRFWTPEYGLGENMRYKFFEGVSIHASQTGPGTTLVAQTEIIGPNQTTHTLPLMEYRGGVQRHFSLKHRVRGVFIQHRIENASPGRVAILAVGERWRPLRLIRSHEIEGTSI